MLQNKIIAITGASSGIGEEMAALFVRHGAKVILLARRTEKLKQVAALLGDQAAFYTLDISSDEAVKTVFQTIYEQHGRIDILINNAGFAKFDNLNNLTIKEIMDMMDVNYMGMVRCTKQVLPQMEAQGTGQMISIVSMAGKIGTPKSTAYAASKHAMLGFINSLRQEMRKSGIVITAINPGPIRTTFFDRADPSGEYLNNLPHWFVLSPEKVAKVVLRAIIKRKREVNIPKVSAFTVKIAQLFPRLFDLLAGDVLDRK